MCYHPSKYTVAVAVSPLSFGFPELAPDLEHLKNVSQISSVFSGICFEKPFFYSLMVPDVKVKIRKIKGYHEIARDSECNGSAVREKHWLALFLILKISGKALNFAQNVLRKSSVLLFSPSVFTIRDSAVGYRVSVTKMSSPGQSRRGSHYTTLQTLPLLTPPLCTVHFWYTPY